MSPLIAIGATTFLALMIGAIVLHILTEWDWLFYVIIAGLAGTFVLGMSYLMVKMWSEVAW